MATINIRQPYHVILAGAHDVGKTTIFEKLKTEFQDSYKFKSLNKQSKSNGGRFESYRHQYMESPNKIKLLLWDTASMEKRGGVGTMTKSYFRQAIAVILVYDTSNLESLHQIREWIRVAEDTCDYSRHLIYALWGNDKGTMHSSVNNPVEPDHVEGLRESLTITIEDQLICRVNGLDQEAVASNYETLIRTVDRKIQDIERTIKEASQRIGEATDTDDETRRVGENTETEEKKGCFC